MPINLFSVSNHLQENGWKLLSTEYKNLKTPLKMQCPKGHEVEDTYDHWRKYQLCDKCQGGKGNKIRLEVPDKGKDVFRILALDAATIVTGFSIYDNDDLVSYGTYKVDRDLDTIERIHKMREWVKEKIAEWQIDEVWIEQIQLQGAGKFNINNVSVFQTLANLQGVLLDVLFEENVEVGLVYPSAWRKACGIVNTERTAVKKATQDAVTRWYGIKATQDESDAICIGKYGVKEHNKENNKTSWGEDI